MFWFDRDNPDVIFGDIRDEEHVLCDGRALTINPDMNIDFRNMPFEDGSFKLVVFDPPHLRHAGAESWSAKSMACLRATGETTCGADFPSVFVCWKKMAC